MTEHKQSLTSPTQRYSIHRALPYWYIACKSKNLRRKPIQVWIWNTPFVLFRDTQGVAHALLDRCPHRNVPLSAGRCIDGHIQCAYHGWKYNGEGHCLEVPALHGPSTNKKRSVEAFPIKEQQGYIWLFTDSKNPPNHDPYTFERLDNPAYISIEYQADFDATLHATAENILDVPHTAFLHRGLFRGGETNLLDTKITRYLDRVECEFSGEPAPSGVMGKLLGAGANQVSHFDRFILPSIAQVDYRIGDARHLNATSVLTPLSDFKTRMYTSVTVKVSKWVSFIKPIATLFAYIVVKQDKDILKKQAEAIQHFSGESYMSTEVDCLGPFILRLLKKAANEQVIVKQDVEDEEPEKVISGKILA